jgi:hypothetical protein
MLSIYNTFLIQDELNFEGLAYAEPRESFSAFEPTNERVSDTLNPVELEDVSYCIIYSFA